MWYPNGEHVMWTTAWLCDRALSFCGKNHYWGHLSTLLQQSVFLQVDDIEWRNENGVILKQDGALPQFSLHVRLALNAALPNYWIGWGGSIAWHPSSPDLTPFHFFMWGYVKNTVYAVNIRDFDHLWGNQYSCSNDHSGQASLYLDGDRVVLHCLKR